VTQPVVWIALEKLERRITVDEYYDDVVAVVAVVHPKI
jgi:hypothetical protein